MEASSSAPEAAGPTVLIAEDEAMIRLVVAETFRDAGYQVLEAADGREALKIFQTDDSIDLLVSDMKMPGMNGYQLAEAGSSLRPDLKILLITGYSGEPVPEKMTAAGVRVLYKPFDINELPFVAKNMLEP